MKIENIVEPTLEPGSAGASSKWVVGDMMWARVAGHPWWPCMVSPDPVSGQFTKHVPSKIIYKNNNKIIKNCANS